MFASHPQHDVGPSRTTHQSTLQFHPYSRQQNVIRTVVVNNVPASTHDDVIRETFSKFGVIEGFRIVNQGTMHKAAYIKFRSPDQCSAAISLNGQQINNATVLVMLAKEDLRDDDRNETAVTPSLPPISQWEAVPAQPPSDVSLRQRIDTMADWYTSAVEKFMGVYNSRKEDSQYGFLYHQNADGVAYYNWKIFCGKQKWSEDQIQQASLKYQAEQPSKTQQQQPSQSLSQSQGTSAPQSAQSLRVLPSLFSSEEAKECKAYLDNIGTTQATIEAAKTWMLTKLDKSRHMLELIHTKMVDTKDATKRINILYLLSDILYSSHANSALISAMTVMIPSIFYQACVDQTEENLAFLKTLIDNWNQGGTFETNVLNTLTQYLEAFRKMNKGNTEKAQQPPTTSRSAAATAIATAPPSSTTSTSTTGMPPAAIAPSPSVTTTVAAVPVPSATSTISTPHPLQPLLAQSQQQLQALTQQVFQQHQSATQLHQALCQAIHTPSAPALQASYQQALQVLEQTQQQIQNVRSQVSALEQAISGGGGSGGVGVGGPAATPAAFSQPQPQAPPQPQPQPQPPQPQFPLSHGYPYPPQPYLPHPPPSSPYPIPLQPPPSRQAMVAMMPPPPQPSGGFPPPPHSLRPPPLLPPQPAASHAGGPAPPPYHAMVGRSAGRGVGVGEQQAIPSGFYPSQPQPQPQLQPPPVQTASSGPYSYPTSRGGGGGAAGRGPNGSGPYYGGARGGGGGGREGGGRWSSSSEGRGMERGRGRGGGGDGHHGGYGYAPPVAPPPAYNAVESTYYQGSGGGRGGGGRGYSYSQLGGRQEGYYRGRGRAGGFSGSGASSRGGRSDSYYNPMAANRSAVPPPSAVAAGEDKTAAEFVEEAEEDVTTSAAVVVDPPPPSYEEIEGDVTAAMQNGNE